MRFARAEAAIGPGALAPVRRSGRASLGRRREGDAGESVRRRLGPHGTATKAGERVALRRLHRRRLGSRRRAAAVVAEDCAGRAGTLVGRRSCAGQRRHLVDDRATLVEDGAASLEDVRRRWLSAGFAGGRPGLAEHDRLRLGPADQTESVEGIPRAAVNAGRRLTGGTLGWVEIELMVCAVGPGVDTARADLLGGRIDAG